jgi:ribose 5-phosphate isomerase A
MEPDSSQDKAKRAAGVQAIATYLKNGMKIGLGSGTTSRWFIHTLGDRVKQGPEVIGVPTVRQRGRGIAPAAWIDH